MKNNIKVINNAKKELTITVTGNENCVEICVDAVKSGRKLADLLPGDIFSMNDVEYIVCEQFDDGTTAIVRKNCLDKTMKFVNNNNWKESTLRKYLNTKYINELQEVFGSENIVAHDVDLLSLDGYDDYGVSVDRVSVMNIDRYRKYHRYIGDTGNSHWLLTPDSTPSGYGASRVQFVGVGGDVSYSSCDLNRGVRPFFVLQSSIVVSYVTFP